MLDEYIHLRRKARDVLEMRCQATIDPHRDRWERCSRDLFRRDVLERLSVPWEVHQRKRRISTVPFRW